MSKPWQSVRRYWGVASAGLCTALFLLASTPASAQINTTKHNLGSNSTQTNKVTGTTADTGTAEVCVFCHTPHGADVTTPNAPPLWNKRLATGATYTTYANLNTPSTDGEILAVGSISVACLSCHDGAQAMDNIINAPGSGRYDTTGGGAAGLGYTWTGNVLTDGRMAPTVALGGVNVANLTGDLSNDHPIGIEYCGGGVSGSGSTVTAGCRDGDFVTAANRLLTVSQNSNQVFWIETGTPDGNKTRTDLPLYTRTFTTRGAGPSVECGSCHDPHVAQDQSGPNGQTAGATFLRISNASSAVCTSCHVK
jgi:hypothetical protein